MKLNQEHNNKFNVVVGTNYCIAFSYSTVIGILDKKNNILFITSEKYGTTTGRHRNSLKNDYCYDNTKVEYKTEKELNEIADKIF